MTIASHIGQYRILRKIGGGGMGLVFLGEHMLLGRRAAIKTLLPTVSANREIVERFFNEARAASAISDPGVIQIFDFGYHVDGTAYIVMELLEGEVLSTRLDRLGRLAPVDALRMARQIAGSLAVAHAQGIIHRDLKPDNIFLVGDAEAQGGERTKILDFGICKIGTGDPALTQSGVMVGTPVYMSPEQCRGAADVDHRADIYAFGCLLFHMLTGRTPFLGDAPGEFIVAHLEEAPRAPSVHVAGLPLAVDVLLLRCLAKSPDDRYQSMTELQWVLGELCAELDGAAPPAPPGPAVVPLGKGFRSIYDGNFVVPGGGDVRSTFAPMSPRTWPWLRSLAISPSSTAPDALDGLPPRRVRGRAVLACVLVGMLVGLVAVSHIVYRAGRGDAEVSRRTALSLEIAPAAPAVSEPVAGTVIAMPGGTLERTRGAGPPPTCEAPRVVKQAAAMPPPRPAPPSAPPSSPPRDDREDLYDAR